ncbi:MAG: glycosyltransferase family 2 protein [Campylobacterales bacterium]
MLISVILDNYNYAKFLPQALDSVLSQTYKNWELIIVDDGSSDESQSIIKEYVNRDSRIKPIFKSNGGQASAFNAGFNEASGDVVCFLDSDDYFAPNKLETIVKYHAQGYQYVYNNIYPVDEDSNPTKSDIKLMRYDGYALFLVYFKSKYFGNVTSTLSLSKELANKVFPLPNEEDWKIQGDDPIVFQASMMSRSKFISEELTYYRIHSSNGHYGKKRSSDYTYELLQKRNSLKDMALKKLSLTQTFLNNGYNLVAEFKTHKSIDFELLKLYLGVTFIEADFSLLKRIDVCVDLLLHYFRAIRSRGYSA